jgi:putative ubiquitin-RnfH superfamily antitoxin RatB of RatAB toxin-antitoxin module
MADDTTSTSPATLRVEVAYALPDKQSLVALDVAAGTTAVEAAEQSGLAQQYDGLVIADAKLGIFGKVVAPTQVLREGDRVEIYRPLIADPKEVRKERAARAKERRASSAS